MATESNDDYEQGTKASLPDVEKHAELVQLLRKGSKIAIALNIGSLLFFGAMVGTSYWAVRRLEIKRDYLQSHVATLEQHSRIALGKANEAETRVKEAERALPPIQTDIQRLLARGETQKTLNQLSLKVSVAEARLLPNGQYTCTRIGNRTGKLVEYELLTPSGWKLFEVGPTGTRTHWQTSTKIQVRARGREWAPKYSIIDHRPTSDEFTRVPLNVFEISPLGRLELSLER